MSETENSDYILDSFAILALLDGEPSAPRVQELLASAERDECRVGMSIINLGEAAYIIERERGLPRVHEVLAAIRGMPISILPADESAVLAAAHLKAQHQMSYADAFAAAAAAQLHATLLTGDREFEALAGSLIAVEWLPR